MFSRCTDRVLLRLRYFGSGLLGVGYFVILSVSVPVGVTMTLLSDAICLPYAWRRRYLDIMFIIGLFSVINTTRLLTL